MTNKKSFHFHIDSLPENFDQAKALGWKFSPVGDVIGKKPYEKVTVNGTAPDGKGTMLFHNVPLGETFVRKEGVVHVPQVVLRKSKPGLSLVEQAKKKNAKSAADREARASRKGGGIKPQQSSGTKGQKNKKQNEARA